MERWNNNVFTNTKIYLCSCTINISISVMLLILPPNLPSKSLSSFHSLLKYSIMWKTRSIYDSVSIFFCCKCSFSSFFYASYSSCLYLMGKKEIKTKREQISFPQIYKTFIHLRCCTFRSILLII